MSATEEIKSRIDIVGYIQRYVPELKKAGRNHKACCPFHTEKTPSFVVNPERQTWHCFGACAEGGDLFTFAQKMHGWDFKEALRELGQEAGIQIRQQTPEQRQRSDRQAQLRGLVVEAAEIYHQLLFQPESKETLNYVIQQRGLSRDTLREFRIGAAPDRWDFILNKLRELGYSEDDIIEAGLAARNDKGNVYDRFRNRLMIPIFDERGRAVGFGGRALNAQEPAKYINSPQSPLFDKGRLLYGLDRAITAIREAEKAIIVEGYMDVIQAHQAGYANVVAQMGTAMTEAQIRRIAPRFAKKIVLALDSDAAGQSAMRRSLEVARQTLVDDIAGRLSVDVRILRMPPGQDPDDVLRDTPATWTTLVDAAQPVADFVIDRETAAIGSDASMQARQQAALEILPILLASENNPYQQENLQKLARRLRISERDLLAWAREQSHALGNARKFRQQPQSTDLLALEAEEMPPEYWDNDYDAPPELASGYGSSARLAGKTHRAIEPYCLAVWLKNPSLLIQVNRKLRVLAGNDSALLNGPLEELCEADFSDSQHRALMAVLLEAISQDDLEPLEYVSSVVEGELLAELRALLSDEPQEVAERTQGAFQVDLHDIFRRRRARGVLAEDLMKLQVSRALQLRLERLERERIELQYLQEEAQNGADADQQYQEHLHRQIMLSMRAKARLDLEVS